MKMSNSEARKLAEMIQRRDELRQLKKFFSPHDRKVEVGKCVVRLHAEPDAEDTEWRHMMLPKSIIEALIENGELETRVDKEIFDIEEQLAIDGIHIAGMPEADPEDTP